MRVSSTLSLTASALIAMISHPEILQKSKHSFTSEIQSNVTTRQRLGRGKRMTVDQLHEAEEGLSLIFNLEA